jgi:MYXO-CTERM domain-containing protein
MSLIALLLSQVGFAATHTVDGSGLGDFSSVQDAVDASTSGDTIEIAAGTYNENIAISAKTLVIQGAGVGATIISGDGTATAFSVSSGGLNLSHMTISGGAQGVLLRGVVGSLSAVEVTNNIGTEQGGGIAVTDSADINLSAVFVTNNTGGDGGGLYLDASSQIEATDAWIEDNSASGSGGGVYSAGKIQVTDSSLYGNTASDDGGGMYATGLSPEVLDSKFWGNTAGANGGGIAIDNGSAGSSVNPRIKGSEFWLNAAEDNGGAIWMDASGLFYLKQILIVLNTAGGDGGGLWISGGQPTNTFVRAWYNSAGNDGGGAYVTGANGGETRKSSFGGNIAGGTGGGAIHASPNAAHAIYNNRYLENTASAGGGLLIDNDANRYSVVSNVDVLGNVGGGVHFTGSAAMKMVNAIIAWNDGDGVNADDTSAEGGILKYNNVHGNTTAFSAALGELLGVDGNIDEDPLVERFMLDGDPISDFLVLSEDSPCVNTGKPEILNRDGSRSDYGSYGGPGAEGGDEDGDGAGPGGGDCDDGDALAAPGLEEVAGDGRDNDCGGGGELDLDGDGSLYPIDCDDDDPDIYPGAADVPLDGVDADCDGLDGEADTGEPVGADTGAPWVDEDTGRDELDGDLDGDGYGDDDCNDADASAYPGAEEVCDDGVDNDCDGDSDDGDSDCAAADKGCGCAARSGGTPGGLLFVMLAGLIARRRNREHEAKA